MAEYSPHGPGGKIADFFYRAWPQVSPLFFGAMLCVLLEGMLACFAPLRPKLTVQSQTLNAKVYAKRPILNTPKERHNHFERSTL